MTPRRRQRMLFVCVLLAGVVVAAVLTFFALGENMLYFFSPSQVKAGEVPAERNVRVGGLVVNGSITRPGDGMTVHFEVTDNAETITVRYRGILPDLFREGQGIVAMGKVSEGGVFVAEEVLAKHDENYMPPEVAEALKTAHEGGKMTTPDARTKP